MIVEETLERLDFKRIRAIVVDKCATPGGKRLAWALSSSPNPEEAERRFRETEEALRFSQDLPFGLCTPADELLETLERERYLAPSDLLKLAGALEGIALIEKKLARVKGNEFELLCARGGLLGAFEDLRMRINACVDSDGVKESASPRLGELRREMAGERRVVLRGLEAIVAARPQIFQESAIHFREGRLVLALRRDRESELLGLLHGISTGGATIFMEPFEVVTANNRLRRLHEEEREETERILLELADAVRERFDQIRASLEAVAQLDFIFARADWARRFKASEVDPAARELEIRSARHPLLILKREVVPLDLVLDPATKVLLISGPNAGGKTVVLKTVGVTSLLASAGLHVPASPDTRFPFFKKVFIDIGDEQSIDEDLSSFTAHLSNLRKIIEEADEESLVLLDELGASTSPEEGGALGMAVLETLLEKGAIVIATTHLESLKYFVEAHPGMQNAGMEFTDRPTYRLIIGIPGASNALEVAEEVGFPSRIIQKARGFLKPELLESSRLISRLSEEHRKAEALRVELEHKLEELEVLRERYEREAADLFERRRNFDREMLLERKKTLRDARKRIENLVREIKESQASREAVLGAKRFIRDEEADIARKAGPAPEVLPELSLGTRVRSSQLKREGVVLELKDGEALVEFGTLKVSLPLSDLEPTKEDAARPAVSLVVEEHDFNPRLQLRGLDAEEAYERLRVYVAEALALGIGEVVIVHGKGTGKLRNIVMEFARKDRHVASFRVGEPFEGGDGVTILRLIV